MDSFGVTGILSCVVVWVSWPVGWFVACTGFSTVGSHSVCRVLSCLCDIFNVCSVLSCLVGTFSVCGIVLAVLVGLNVCLLSCGFLLWVWVPLQNSGAPILGSGIGSSPVAGL